MNSFLNKKVGVLRYQDIIALICFIATFIFLCWKAPFGYVKDEDFYLSIPFRLTMGDSLITHEWHVSQLSGFLLYLPVKIYISLVGSTEGIVLFFRYLFVVMQGTVSLIIYRVLRKHGIFSVFAMIIYFLHIPNTVMALSYNTMGLSFVALIGLLMFETRVFSRFKFYVTGLLVACAVLCNPILVFVYLLFTVCMIIYEATKNKDQSLFSFSGVSFSLKTWLYITLGIASVAAVFFLFLFSKTSIKEMFDNLPMLLTDPEYRFSSKTGGQNLITMGSLFEIISINPYLFGIYSILMVSIAFDKKRIARRPFYLSVVSIVFLIYVICLTAPSGAYFYSPSESILYWMFPFALLGLACYVLSERKDRHAFVFLWLLGVLYAICLEISSDLGPKLSTLGLAVSNIAGVVFIKNIIDELLTQKKETINVKPVRDNKNAAQKKISSKVLTSILAATLIFQISLELYFDSIVVFSSFEHLYEGPGIELNSTFETGPLKGMKTTAYRAEVYKKTLSDLSKIKADGKGTVLITSDRPWCYLYLEMPYAAYSAITGDFYVGQPRLTQYYVLHPQKTPHYMYVSKYEPRAYIYNPKGAEQIVADLSRKTKCIVEESSVGYVIEIIK